MKAEQKTAIVTGGTSGIGQAVTVALARQGYFVYATGNDAEQAVQTTALLAREDLPGEVVTSDVTDPNDAGRIALLVEERHGRIDALCNNAAIRPVGNLMETDPGTWDRTMAVNVKGTYLFCRAVLPAMIRSQSGVIVNMCSGSGYGGRGHIAYCTSKGAIFAFTKSMAVDYIKDHIRVNAVVPGFTLTTMTQDFTQERKAATIEMNVTGRMRVPEDIAGVVVFLMSDAAATVTGATWEVGAMDNQMVMAAN